MNKLLKVALVTAMLCTSSLSLAEEKIVAKIGESKVTLTEVMSMYKEYVASQPSLKDKKFEDLEKNLQEFMVKSYINKKLLDQEVKNSKVEDSAVYKEKLANIKGQLANHLFIENYVKTKVSENEIKSEFDKLKKELSGKEEVKVSHILVEKEEKAKEIKSKLDKGASFSELAKESSIDEVSKINGGTLEYFSKNQMVPEFDEKAFALKKGQISEPVKTQFGWHIIKVEDKRAVKVPSYEEAKPAIQNKLNSSAVEELIEELNKKNNVKITF